MIPIQDDDTYPRAIPFTQEQLRSAYAYASDVPFCKNGHAMTGDNVSYQKDGKGRWQSLPCRQCNKDRAKRWREANAHRLERKPGGTGKTLRRDARNA